MKRFVTLLICVVICVTNITLPVNAQRDVSNEEMLAQELKSLNLFKGVSDTDFDLDRAPSRVEAIVMLIRVLGKENEVIGDTWNHPFTDVPAWANNYIGYAYSKGLTNGQSATLFGTGNANAAMYLTFVLRALGYSDTNGVDFSWDNPYSLAKETGILTDAVNTSNFWRADVVTVSHLALSAYIKGSQQTLAQKLISAGVFTKEQFDSIHSKNDINYNPNTKVELTAEEIYEQCSPAVFYIEVHNSKGNAVASGSGFFIDDKGTAVTNYHVIEGGYSSSVQISGSETMIDVLGVYDYNETEDWAIIKVDCTGNKYLNIDNTSKVAGGQKVYAIGSPLGLQNTISEGIVSNPTRKENNAMYIQTNAAISNGSSGGALIDKYGSVIGITSAGYADGQNLNLALPISYIDEYNSSEIQSFVFLVTGNKKSKIKTYSSFPNILDCGAFYGVEPFDSTNSTFFYDLSYVTSNSWRNGRGCEDYRKALEDFGCIYIGDFFDGTSNTVGWKYSFSTTLTDYIIFEGYTTHQGIKSLFVHVEVNHRESVKGYAKTSHVPDFGEYFGINLYWSHDLKNGDKTIITNYKYSIYDLMQTKYDEVFFELYMSLLLENGFILKTQSIISDGGVAYTFTHPQHIEEVVYSITEEFVNVNIFY